MRNLLNNTRGHGMDQHDVPTWDVGHQVHCIFPQRREESF